MTWFLILVCCYYAIARRIRRPTGSISNQSKLNRSVRRKVTRMSILLVISYTLCYAPYYIWQIFRLEGIPVSSIIVSEQFQLSKFRQYIM